MTVALLRAVNVAGHKPLSMAELRALAEKMGLKNVATILQSGNLLFDGKTTEALLESKLGTDVFVRTQAEMDAIVRNNPFPEEAKNDPGRLVVLFLKQTADGSVLQKAIKGREIARGRGRELYVYYPDGQGRSKLTNALIEKTLGTRATARNWNSVLKLQHGVER